MLNAVSIALATGGAAMVGVPSAATVIQAGDGCIASPTAGDFGD